MIEGKIPNSGVHLREQTTWRLSKIWIEKDSLVVEVGRNSLSMSEFNLQNLMTYNPKPASTGR